MSERKLTHIDPHGRPAMVDVSGKPATLREATARGRVRMAQATLDRVRGVDLDLVAADDRALAHAACDHRRMTRHAAAGGEHGARSDEAMKVFRRGLLAHEDHMLAIRRALLGDIGIEHRDAARR